MTCPVFEVRIGARVLRTANWSLGGLLLIGPCEEPLSPGESVSGSIAPAGAGGTESVPFTARVVRHTQGDDALAIRFEPLDARLLAFLERYLRRGSRRPDGRRNP